MGRSIRANNNARGRCHGDNTDWLSVARAATKKEFILERSCNVMLDHFTFFKCSLPNDLAENSVIIDGGLRLGGGDYAHSKENEDMFRRQIAKSDASEIAVPAFWETI